MDKNVIIAARKNYRKMMMMKQELAIVKQELQKMQHDGRCRESLKVIEKEEAKMPSEEEILKYSFYSVEPEEPECEFYVFIGAYRHGKKENYRVKDYRTADYFVYQNLEAMFSGKVIYPQEQAQFEKEHIVFKFSEDEDSREKFLKLQEVYFRQYLNNDNISQTEIFVELTKHL